MVFKRRRRGREKGEENWIIISLYTAFNLLANVSNVHSATFSKWHKLIILTNWRLHKRQQQQQQRQKRKRCVYLAAFTKYANFQISWNMLNGCWLLAAFGFYSPTFWVVPQAAVAAAAAANCINLLHTFEGNEILCELRRRLGLQAGILQCCPFSSQVPCETKQKFLMKNNDKT